MPYVRFTRDHDHRPDPRTIIAYKEGDELNVSKACADEAIAERAANRVAGKRPEGGDADGR